MPKSRRYRSASGVTENEIAADPVLIGMRRDGVPLTRENYILRNWGELPDEWTAEHEDELPRGLQNWAGFDE